jgi:lipopolysaccharide export LptBFGC system permease protein LptF
MAELVAYAFPGILVLALPIAFLIGILMALGHLGFTGELTAMRASGIAAHQLVLPFAVVGVLLAVVDHGLYDYAVPWGNTEHRKLRVDIGRKNPALILEDGTVMRSLETAGLLWLYDHKDPVTGHLINVSVWDDFRDGHPRLSLAEEASVGLHEGRGALTLYNGVSYERESDQLTTVVRNRFAREIIYIPLGEDIDRGDHAFKDYRAMSQASLEIEMSAVLKQMAAETSGLLRPVLATRYRRAAVEWHKKITIPVACLAFALVGVPLGVITRRSGFMVGLVYGLPLIIIFYVLLRVGETLARAGSAPPWLGAWMPNLVVLAVAGILTRQMLRR